MKTTTSRSPHPITATLAALALLVSAFLTVIASAAQTSPTAEQPQERQRRAEPAATPKPTPEVGSEAWIKQQEAEADAEVRRIEADVNKNQKAQERKARNAPRTTWTPPPVVQQPYYSTTIPDTRPAQPYIAGDGGTAAPDNGQAVEPHSKVWGILLLIPIVALILFKLASKKDSELRRSVLRLLTGAAGMSICGIWILYQLAPISLVWQVADVLSILGLIASFIVLCWGLVSTTVAVCNVSGSRSTRRALVVGVSLIIFLVGLTAAVFSSTQDARDLIGRKRDMVGFLGGVTIVLSLITLSKGLHSTRTPGRDDSASYHGTARFATDEEEGQFTFPISLERGEVPSPGCFILGPAKKRDHLVVLPLDLTRLHGLILGSTGTGKSRGYFMPNCAAAEGTSIVVTDPKSELWKYTSGFHKRPRRYAPAEPDASLCFNWIPLCSDARMAELCARAIIESGNTTNTDQFWIDAETAYLSAIFAHASTLPIPTPLTAYRLFTRQKPEQLLKQLQNSPSETAREQATIFAQTDARIKGAIVPAVAAKLQWMRDKDVARFTSASLESPNFGEIRRQATAIYWCLREQDITRLRPLTSLFFTVLLEQVAGEQIAEGAASVPITMMMDEFANIGTIPDFATTLTLARGRGVAIWLGVQSLSQFEARYGRANAQVIISNLSNKVALHGLDITTAEYVSRMLGDTTVVAKRSNLALSTGGIGVVRQQTEHRRPLMTPDEVMLISEGEAIVRSGNRRPMILPKMWYDQEPRTARATPLGEAQTMSFATSTNDEKSLPEIPQLPGPITTTSVNKVDAASTGDDESDAGHASAGENGAGVILVDEMMLTDPYTK